MNLLRATRPQIKVASSSLAETDYCQVVTKDADRLYWLAYVLTGDSRQAQECFVSGLGECMHFTQVFKDWAESWSRRAIIKNAIRMTHPRPDGATGVLSSDGWQTADPELSWLTGNLLRLPAFERFVFVMSVMERYKEHECAVLLNCTIAHVNEARLRALQQMSEEPTEVTEQLERN